jgi:ribosomal protein L16 Arg81 hydroxylase
MVEQGTHSGYFDNFLKPVCQSDFFDKSWQQNPLLIKRDQVPSSVAQAMLPEEVDDIIRRAAVNATDFDYFAAGDGVDSSRLAGKGNFLLIHRLLGLFAEGGTIHISNLQKYHERSQKTVDQLQPVFGSHVESDLWLTRHNQFPAYLHFDSHDIFTHQAFGRKRWRVFAPIIVAEARNTAKLNWEDVGEPIFDVILEPGDLLYMPAFTPHAVTTVDPISIHVGFGVHPLTWRDVVERALEQLSLKPNILQTSVFRTPTNSADTAATLKSRFQDVISAVVEAMDFNDLKMFAEQGRFGPQSAPSDTTMRDLIAETKLSENSILVRKQPLWADVISTATRATLIFTGGGEISASSEALQQFEFMKTVNHPFTANDMPDSLPLDDRLAIAQRLFEVGFCQLQ